MNINKARWITEGDNVRFSMPIGKIDEERRIVSGFATLDNVDKQNDIVTTEASINAFKKFRGNIREMHAPLAVGKMVDFKEDKYFDPQTKQFYKGVYVSAYISKGAQDTWEKVLDGTLTGFSIGGNITKSDDSYDDKLDKSIRIIKEYDLHELSLVDNPANQLANIVSIQKVNGENQVGGFLFKAEVENVFWDSENDTVLISSSDSENSPHSGKPMQNIGFIEKSDAENAEMIKFLVDSAKGIKTIKMQKEEGPMTEETTAAEVTETPAEEVVENVEVAPEAQPEEVAAPVEEVAPAVEESAPSEAVEKSAEAEAHTENNDIAKSEEAVAEAVADIKNSLTNAFGDLAATIKSINDKVAELSKSIADVTNSVASVTKDVADVKGSFNEFGKRVDKVEADTAFRKSGDLGEIVQELAEVPVQKSLWGGRFLKNTDLFN